MTRPRLESPPDKNEDIAALSRLSDREIMAAAQRAALEEHDLERATGVFRLATEPPRSATTRLLAQIALADLETARGRWGNARQGLAAVSRTDPALGLLKEASLATIPVGLPARDQLDQLRTRLKDWTVTGRTVEDVPELPRAWHRHLRHYYLGRLSARLGEFALAGKHADSISLLDVPPPSGQSDFARELADGVRVGVLVNQQRFQIALTLLERMPADGTEGLLPRATHRFERAQLLHTLGRRQEAATLYAGFETRISDLVFLGMTHLRRAEILEARGRRQEAIPHYQSVADLYSAADAELASLSQHARQRIATGTPPSSRGALADPFPRTPTTKTPRQTLP